VRGVESPSPAALVSGEMEDGSGGKYSLYIVWCNGMSGRKSCELRDVSFVVLLEVQVQAPGELPHVLSRFVCRRVCPWAVSVGEYVYRVHVTHSCLLTFSFTSSPRARRRVGPELRGSARW
jgi:hypothetical protein